MHWFDTSKSPELVWCNCPRGLHEARRHDYRLNYASMAESINSNPHAGEPSPEMYAQPSWGQPIPADPMYNLTAGMTNLAVDSTYPHTSSYATTGYPAYADASAYAAGYAHGSGAYPVQSPTTPTTYEGYAQYPLTYAGYPEMMAAGHPQYSYPTPGYTPASQYASNTTAGATRGGTSASYGINASGHLVNTTNGYITTERNTLILRNLDPKTTERDVEKEVAKARVTAVSIKVKKSDQVKKKSVWAHVSFKNWQETNKVKEFFEHSPRHIRNRAVSVSLGKESIPAPPPCVVSSTDAN